MSSPSAPPQSWTTRDLLHWMTQRFEQAAIDSSRVVAEMLLGHVLGCERMRLYMEVDREATAEERTRLRDLVRRALDHEPVQYLVGEAWFFGQPFEVDRSTLIPRPSTETLMEAVLIWYRQRYGEVRVKKPHWLLDEVVETAITDIDTSETSHDDHGAVVSEEASDQPESSEREFPASIRIADIGTGTGCIAISLAMQIPNATVVATDIEPAALDLARRNAERHNVADRVEFRVGDLLEPLGDEQFDVICSNPPYIPDHEWDAVPRNVKAHEPERALRGGKEGLDVIGRLLERADRHIRSGGGIFCEIADCQRNAVRRLADEIGGCKQVEVLRDHEGLWRVLVAQRGD